VGGVLGREEIMVSLILADWCAPPPLVSCTPLPWVDEDEDDGGVPFTWDTTVVVVF
jgi:hypothetical protein